MVQIHLTVGMSKERGSPHPDGGPHGNSPHVQHRDGIGDRAWEDDKKGGEGGLQGKVGSEVR